MTDPRPAGPTLENRLPDEGINSSAEHPLREFAWLIGASVATLLAAIALVGWSASRLAPHLPFSVEQDWAARWIDAPVLPKLAARTDALQALADRIAARMDLSPGMTLVVGYDDAMVVNAYATIGGRIRVYRGLLQTLKSEDAVAALLAHEIAHVKHRHVASNLGRGVAISLLLGLVSSDAGAGAAAAQRALGAATDLTLQGYSRGQEQQADDDALRAVVALYGHAAGFEELFARLGESGRENGLSIELLRSHPLTQARIDHAHQQAQAAGWRMKGAATPLPAALVGSQPSPAD